MKAITRLFAQPGFLVFMFCLAVSLFNWPLLSIAAPLSGGLYMYLFLAWAGIIVILGLVARVLPRCNGESEGSAGRAAPGDSRYNGQQG